MARGRVQPLLLSGIALVGLGGCAVSKVLVPYGVETGHTLSAADYAHLQKVADALPGQVVFYRTKDQPPPIQSMPLVGYAYAFRSGVDVGKLQYRSVSAVRCPVAVDKPLMACRPTIRKTA